MDFLVGVEQEHEDDHEANEAMRSELRYMQWVSTAYNTLLLYLFTFVFILAWLWFFEDSIQLEIGEAHFAFGPD